jgi:hypothetical protein
LESGTGKALADIIQYNTDYPDEQASLGKPTRSPTVKTYRRGPQPGCHYIEALNEVIDLLDLDVVITTPVDSPFYSI